MNQLQSNRRTAPLILGALVIVVLLFGGLMLVAAQETDGRVNAVEHVGGAAVYCVDENFEPAADNWSDGGIRVLDAQGQELLFAPAADIIAAGDPPEETVLVGEGANAYGPLTLYYMPNSKFQLNGIDEHGKDFEFIWGGCGYQAPFEAPVDTTPEIMPTATCPPVQDSTIQQIQPTVDPCRQPI